MPLFLMKNRKLFGGSDAAVPSFLEMSCCENRAKNVTVFKENRSLFSQHRPCFLSEFFIEPSRFFAGIDAASGGMELCDLRSSVDERRICGCLHVQYASCFAGKNAAEFLFMRANDGNFFLIIPPLQPAFLSLKSTALRSTKTTESIQILIGKVYLSALLREKKDGGMCPARVCNACPA